MSTTEATVEPVAKKWDVLTAVRWGDGLLSSATRILSADRFVAAETRIEKAGHYALILSAALGLLYGISGAIKWNQLSVALAGLAWVLCVGVAQYVAFKFLSTIKGLIKNSGSRLSSTAVPTCLALWSLLLGLVTFAGLTYAAIRTDSFMTFGKGVALFATCELVAWLCLNPSLVNINILPVSSAGEEALGLYTFVWKAVLRLVPVAFGIGLIAGDLEMIVSIVQLFQNQGNSVWAPPTRTILFFAALPLVGYLLFVASYLVLDCIRAVLSIPEKLDTLAKK